MKKVLNTFFDSKKATGSKLKKNYNNVIFLINEIDGFTHYNERTPIIMGILRETFENMSFKVNIGNMRNWELTMKYLRTVTKNMKSTVDCCVVIIATQTFTYEPFEMGLHFERIISHFNAENCPVLKDKPKVFIFQHMVDCTIPEDHRFTFPSDHLLRRIDDNTLIAHSTAKASYVSHIPGWYLKKIREAFTTYGKAFDIESLIEDINRQVHLANSSEGHYTGFLVRSFTKYYLYDGVDPDDNKASTRVVNDPFEDDATTESETRTQESVESFILKCRREFLDDLEDFTEKTEETEESEETKETEKTEEIEETEETKETEKTEEIEESEETKETEKAKEIGETEEIEEIEETEEDIAIDTIPIYKTAETVQGEVIIINNIMFMHNDDYRQGAEVDGQNIRELFEAIGFNVQSRDNLTATSMRRELEMFSRSLVAVDICVVIIMSHGTNRSVLGGYTEIFGVDDDNLNVEEVLSYFSYEACPSLRNKPKIFIFQCCRGTNTPFFKEDAIIPPVTIHSDTLIAYSTLPGFSSLRDPLKGTWYIQTICEVFKKHARKFDIESLLKLVDIQMEKYDPTLRQVTHYECRGFKRRCYLYPF